jgi:hypothetical protein
MNQLRGLVRAWIVASFAWVVLWAAYIWLSCDYIPRPVSSRVSELEYMCRTSLLGDWMVRPAFFGLKEYGNIILTALLPPIVVLIFGHAIRWAVRGFGATSSN